MDTPSPSMRNLARRLLDLEAASPGSTVSHAHVAVRVFEKLRDSLTRFAGSDGFSSLLRRAVALARVEDPSLHRVTINPDCTIAGLEDVGAGAGDADRAVAVVAQLLGLLETFIGEPLTLRLVREAWPGQSLGE